MVIGLSDKNIIDQDKTIYISITKGQSQTSISLQQDTTQKTKQLKHIPSYKETSNL